MKTDASRPHQVDSTKESTVASEGDGIRSSALECQMSQSDMGRIAMRQIAVCQFALSNGPASTTCLSDMDGTLQSVFLERRD